MNPHTVKSQVRKRMRRTGETYSTALRHIQSKKIITADVSKYFADIGSQNSFDALIKACFKMVLDEGEFEYDPHILSAPDSELGSSMMEYLVEAGMKIPYTYPDELKAALEDGDEERWDLLLEHDFSSLLITWLKSCTKHNDYLLAMFCDNRELDDLLDSGNTEINRTVDNLREIIIGLALTKVNVGNSLLPNHAEYGSKVQKVASKYVGIFKKQIALSNLEVATDPMLLVTGDVDEISAIAERQSFQNMTGGDRVRINAIYDYLDGNSNDPAFEEHAAGVISDFMYILQQSAKKNKDNVYENLLQFMQSTSARRAHWESVKQAILGPCAERMETSYQDIYTALYDSEDRPFVLRILYEDMMCSTGGKSRQFVTRYIDGLDRSEYIDGLIDDLGKMVGVDPCYMQVIDVNRRDGTMVVSGDFPGQVDSPAKVLSAFAPAAKVGDTIYTRIFTSSDGYKYTSDVVFKFFPQELKVLARMDITEIELWLMKRLVVPMPN